MKRETFYDTESLLDYICSKTSEEPDYEKILSVNVSLFGGKPVSTDVGAPKTLNPDSFIGNDISVFFTVYNRFKRYGFNVMYGEEVPNVVIEAIDIIEDCIAKYESQINKNLEKQAEQAKKDKSKKKALH